MPLAQSDEQARIQVEQPIDQFHRNLPAHNHAEYREERVRLECINVVFGALGWDVRNSEGYAEPYKDVSHEEQGSWTVKVARWVGPQRARKGQKPQKGVYPI